MPVHLTIAANQQHVVPIDVVGDFYVRLDKYVGFGELRAEFVAAYDRWAEAMVNPPKFEVKEAE